MFVRLKTADGRTPLIAARIILEIDAHEGGSAVRVPGYDDPLHHEAEPETLAKHIENLYLEPSERHSQRLCHTVAMALEMRGDGNFDGSGVEGAIDELRNAIDASTSALVGALNAR